MRKKTIGQIIREIRTERGMSQLALGEVLDVSYQQVQKYEKGDDISVRRLEQIARAFKVPITVFLFGLPDKWPTTPAVNGKKIAEDEVRIIKLYRRIKTQKSKIAAAELLKTVRNL